MSVWSLKTRGFSFDDCRSKSLSTVSGRRGKKRRDVKHCYALANRRKTPAQFFSTEFALGNSLSGICLGGILLVERCLQSPTLCHAERHV
jgi:hypothetical protein